MSIVRTLDWRLTIPPVEAVSRLQGAFDQLGLDPHVSAATVAGHSKANLLKNRWAATIAATVTPYQAGSLVELRVDMPAGTKHYSLASDIATAVGEDAYDDRGLGQALVRLSRISKVGGWLELRNVRNYLTATETVHELGQGNWSGHAGLIVLTDERIFFFDKALVGATVEEFPLAAITSVTVNKRLGGEALAITVASNVSSISGMMHGQGDALLRTYRKVKADAATATAAAATGQTSSQHPASDADEIGKLADLRDRGILTEDEFAAKKAQILGI